MSGKSSNPFQQTQGDRDFSQADHKASSRKNYQSRSYYSGFKSEQDFYDFYTKNFYQKASHGRSYEKAKEEWEQTRRKHEEYQRTASSSYQEDPKAKEQERRWRTTQSNESHESHQSTNSQESQRAQEQEFHYKEYYRDKNPHHGSDRYEKQEEKKYGEYYEKFKQSFYKNSRYSETKKNYKNLYEEWKKTRKDKKEEKKYKDYVPDESSPFHRKTREKVRQIFRNRGNFFRIINLTKGKTDTLFLSALRAFKVDKSRDSFKRGSIHWKDFTKMFPFKWSICALLGMSLFYRLLIMYKI